MTDREIAQAIRRADADACMARMSDTMHSTDEVKRMIYEIIGSAV